MAGLSAKVGYYLRNFCYSPTYETYEAKAKGDFIFQIAETIIQVFLNPTHTGFTLLHAVRFWHYFLIALVFLALGERVYLLLFLKEELACWNYQTRCHNMYSICEKVRPLGWTVLSLSVFNCTICLLLHVWGIFSQAIYATYYSMWVYA